MPLVFSDDNNFKGRNDCELQRKHLIPNATGKRKKKQNKFAFGDLSIWEEGWAGIQ